MSILVSPSKCFSFTFRPSEITAVSTSQLSMAKRDHGGKIDPKYLPCFEFYKIRVDQNWRHFYLRRRPAKKEENPLAKMLKNGKPNMLQIVMAMEKLAIMPNKLHRSAVQGNSFLKTQYLDYYFLN